MKRSFIVTIDTPYSWDFDADRIELVLLNELALLRFPARVQVDDAYRNMDLQRVFDLHGYERQ